MHCGATERTHSPVAKRDERVALRFSREEMLLLDRLTGLERLSRAEVIRRAVRFRVEALELEQMAKHPVVLTGAE